MVRYWRQYFWKRGWSFCR